MEELENLARLIKARNKIDDEIASVIGRPPERGHVGEYVAANIFRIVLNQSAAQPGNDGYFSEGPLTGKSVNIKCYGKQEGILDIT
jgi:hypothetical protein